MILCCGEALIDMIPHSTDVGRDGFVPFSGGAIFNTAVALGRLGADVSMMTGLSDDMFGQQLSAELKASNVGTDLIATRALPTTLAFVQLVDGHARYSFYDENTAGRSLLVEDLPQLDASVQALYFGGISLCSLPAADTYAAFAEREAGRTIMLDPNIRPSFVDDEPAYRARLARIIAVSDIVKVSDEDLSWIFPDAADLNAAVSEMLKAGPKLLILTRGGEGASAYHQQGWRVDVAARKAEVVDTVGAGDTFNAGVLAKTAELELLSPEAIETLTEDAARDILAFGADVAAVTVSRAGANPPWRHELT